MGELLSLLLDPSGFPPRWYCGRWTGVLGWTHIISDSLIFAAYIAIPVVLTAFVMKRQDVPFPRVFWLFGLFILACGTTHLIEAVIFWNPVYRLAGIVKAITALVSWATVVALVPTLRQALQLRSPAELERIVAARTQELTEQRDKNAQLAAVVAASNEIITSQTLDGHVLSWNAAAETVYGYTEEEARGAHISIVVAPEHRDELYELLRRVRAGEHIRHHESYRVDRHGRTHLISLSLSPIKNAEGRVVGVSSVGRDITDLRDSKLQLAAVNEELTMKNADLEQFVYTVSHDLKAPLVTATGFMSRLRKALDQNDDDKALDSLKRIERAITRMNGLISDLLELNRTGFVKLELKTTALRPIVEAACVSATHVLETAGAETRFADLPRITMDAGKVQQIFENLLANAAKFRRTDRPLVIEVGAEARPEEDLVFVRDNGIGIDPKQHERIFGIFERLDPDVEGTGVGLAIVNRLMSQHGGRAWVTSTPDKGSTFWLAFPKNRPSGDASVLHESKTKKP